MRNDLRDVFSTLLLFFCLMVVSIVMVFSSFEKGTVDFWSEQEGLVKAVDALTESDVFDLDNTNTVGGVDEIGQNSTLSK